MNMPVNPVDNEAEIRFSALLDCDVTNSPRQVRRVEAAVLIYPVALETRGNFLMRQIALLLLTSAAMAQTPATDAKAYVKFDQPTIVLNHVRVIDGTGAPAKSDRSIVISNGKIQSIGERRTTINDVNC